MMMTKTRGQPAWHAFTDTMPCSVSLVITMPSYKLGGKEFTKRQVKKHCRTTGVNPLSSLLYIIINIPWSL
jgi:hypothetical protein